MDGIMNSGGGMTAPGERGTAVTDLKGRGERMSTEEKKLVRFGKWKEFLSHRLCFLLNGAGWELNWGFKESEEGW